jgi:signal transduction histidine kinase
MRLAFKITLALTLWTVIVLAVMSQRGHAHRLAIIRSDLAEALVLMGKTLQPFAAEAYARGGHSQVEAAVGAAFASEQSVGLRWITSAELSAGLADRELAEAASRAASTQRDQIAQFPAEAPEAIYAYLPVVLADGTAVIELRRSLALQHDLEDRSRRQLAITVSVIGSCALFLAMGFGWLLVGQRVDRLVGLARAVGRGETGQQVPPAGGDELGELTEALNKMVLDLHAMRARNAQATAERDRLAHELRHTDRLATIGALMARLAHELGTPLNVVAARSKLIARRQVEGEAVIENARVAAEQTDRIAAVVRRFLDFSRGAREPAQAFTVPILLEHVQTLLGGLANERDVELVIASDPPSAELVGDPLVVQQALTNLVSNAIDAAPPRSPVVVDVGEAFESPPAGRGRGPGRYVRITVSDRGAGIDPVVLPHLFEPFFTTKPRGTGTGLGLSIASGIAHDHGGWIDVESSDGMTRFTMHLPVASGDEQLP